MDRYLQEHMDMTPVEAARMRLDRYIQAEADRIAALKQVYLVKHTPEGKVESIRDLELERYQEDKEAEAREQERIERMVLEALGVEPKAQTAVAEKTQQWRKDLTPETLNRLMREMEKIRLLDTVRAAMEAPYIMPQPLEAPVYELDLERTCPICGNAKRKGAGICNRCFYRGLARF